MNKKKSKWYQEAVIYQLHVRAFYDSNKDGIGDFVGLYQRLPYLKDLGVTAVWLMPFYPSPLKDDGYDISNYYEINPIYGTLDDFKLFLKEAHRLGLKVITELVLNHTSDQHPWFQAARRSPAGSPERDFYVWSDTPNKYVDARIIFQDFENSNWTLDPVAGAYYWHRFYSHQPDLNFNNPQVQAAMMAVVDYWLEMGVDGLRLDAIPYLFEKEGTNCENLPETHDFLRKLRAHVDARYKNRMLLAEANQWAEDAVAYFGNGDECHMCFHFPLMPRMFMAIEKEDRFPITDILGHTPPIPENSQWAIFLRNHDELTLEMVTDEDRDFMYNVFAYDARAKINLGIRRRLAPLLGNNRKKIELLNSILFSLPGAPILYYGDEIGMGDNIYLGDRNGVRTPLQWSIDRNAGFSQASSQQLYLPVIVDHEYHFEAVNIENQKLNINSLLWWMKKMISLRKDSLALSLGSLKILHPNNHRVLAFLRIHENEKCFLVANLSRHVQYVEVDLSEYKGHVPVEMFGQTDFPAIGDKPMSITMGPYQYYWFELDDRAISSPVITPSDITRSIMIEDSSRVFHNENLYEQLPAVLRDYFAGTVRMGANVAEIASMEIQPIPVELEMDAPCTFITIALSYPRAASETHLLPLAYIAGERAGTLCESYPRSVISKLVNEKGESIGILFDASVLQEFRSALLRWVANPQQILSSKFFSWKGGEIKIKPGNENIERSELFQQHNSTMVFEGEVVLRLLHKMQKGVHPEVELGEMLEKKEAVVPVAPYVGQVLLKIDSGDLRSAILVHQYVSNKRNLYDYTLDELGHYYEQVLLYIQNNPGETTFDEMMETTKELSSLFFMSIQLLGKRLGEFHNVLADTSAFPDFMPEKINEYARRSLYQSFREKFVRSFLGIEENYLPLKGALGSIACDFLKLRDRILERAEIFLKNKIGGLKIRAHGQLALDLILFTGRDFVILDFEGNHEKPFSARKLRKHPLVDIGGLINSIRDVSEQAMSAKNISADSQAVLAPWKNAWFFSCVKQLLDGYFSQMDEKSNNMYYKNDQERDAIVFLFVVEELLSSLVRDIKRKNVESARAIMDIITRMLLEQDCGLNKK